MGRAGQNGFPKLIIKGILVFIGYFYISIRCFMCHYSLLNYKSLELGQWKTSLDTISNVSMSRAWKLSVTHVYINQHRKGIS